MMNLSRNRRAAALGLLLAAAWPAALPAQDTNTVGNPQLRDFQLPGQRTTPPAPVQPPAATAPATPRPPPAAAPATRSPIPATAVPTPRPEPALAAPRETAPTRAERRLPASRRETPAAPPAIATPTPAPVAQTPAPAPQAAPPVAAPAPTRPAPTAAPAAESSGLNWLWILLPLLLIGLGAVAFLRRNRIAERDEARRGALAGALVAGERTRPPTPEPSPAESAPERAIAATPEPAPAEATRPWLEIDIEPDRAAATQSEASLHYDLVVTNVGGETARNIRIDTRMFNAADEQDIAAFLGGPIHRHSGSPHITLPPGETMRLTSAIGMKAEEVRAIELQGRRIFVPSIAINLAYDWNEDGEGRTSKSWLVGRKPDNPQARMGAFRLDLGPRIYRSVDRKDTKRVMV
jgi:hypothetical protein